MIKSAVIVALPALVLLTGCATAVRPDGPARAPATAVRPAPIACPSAVALQSEGPSTLETHRWPLDFEPVSGVYCMLTRTTSRTFVTAIPLSDVGPLATALRQPSESGTPRACTAYGFVQPWIALADQDGHWTRVTFPVDRCSHPLRAATEAFRVSTRRR